MAENYEEQVARVKLMARGTGKWDLSENDVLAIGAVLEVAEAARSGEAHDSAVREALEAGGDETLLHAARRTAKLADLVTRVLGLRDDSGELVKIKKYDDDPEELKSAVDLLWEIGERHFKKTLEAGSAGMILKQSSTETLKQAAQRQMTASAIFEENSKSCSEEYEARLRAEAKVEQLEKMAALDERTFGEAVGLTLEANERAQRVDVLVGDVMASITGQRCGRCDYDEASGDVVSHCDHCCRRITTLVFTKLIPVITEPEALGLPEGELTHAQVVDGMMGMYAYDTGGRDSGLKDESLRVRIKAVLDAMDERAFRVFLSDLLREQFVSERAIRQGYGHEDVKAFFDWLGDEMGIDV